MLLQGLGVKITTHNSSFFFSGPQLLPLQPWPWPQEDDGYEDYVPIKKRKALPVASWSSGRPDSVERGDRSVQWLEAPRRPQNREERDFVAS